jgi:hypothetical protein
MISEWPCSWKEHELVELRDGMLLSFREKLLWLEEATEFARQLQKGHPSKETPARADVEAGSAFWSARNNGD